MNTHYKGYQSEEIKQQLSFYQAELDTTVESIKLLEAKKKGLETKLNSISELIKKEKIRYCEEHGGHEFYPANEKWKPISLMYCYSCPKEIGR